MQHSSTSCSVRLGKRGFIDSKVFLRRQDSKDGKPQPDVLTGNGKAQSDVLQSATSSRNLPRHEDKDARELELSELRNKVAELSAQASNEERAVRQMQKLSAEVQQLTDKLRQCNAAREESEKKAAREAQTARHALEKCDVANKARAAAEAETERTSSLVSKLTKQVDELQAQISDDWLQRTVLQKQIDSYEEELKHVSYLRDLLDDEKRCRQKLESQLLEEQNVCTALREEFHARVLGNKVGGLEDCAGLLRPRLTDEQSVDAFGEVLQRAITSLPASAGLRVKRRLLISFHPDKNPELGLATRIAQVLNSIEIAGTPSADAWQDAPNSARCSPTMYTPRNSSRRTRPERSQSARPGCRPGG